MKEIKFRARIDPNTVLYFTLEDLVNPEPLFSIRELVIPWLRAGNKPDEYTGRKDKNREIYEGDTVKCLCHYHEVTGENSEPFEERYQVVSRMNCLYLDLIREDYGYPEHSIAIHHLCEGRDGLIIWELGHCGASDKVYMNFEVIDNIHDSKSN